MSGHESGRRAIYLNWDGFAYDYYQEAMRRPERFLGLTRIAREGHVFRGNTGIPSLTVPMQTTLVTGAWPAQHGNMYRFLNRETEMVEECGHLNRCETIAEACRRSGLKVASVNQFTLRERGTAAGDPDNPYIDAGPSFRQRFAVARDIWAAERHDLLCIYCDELDAAGHNFEGGCALFGGAVDEGQRRRHVMRQLRKMDGELCRLFDHLESKGSRGPVALVLATDHGMTPYHGTSSLPDLLSRLKAIGAQVQVMNPGDHLAISEGVAIVSAGLQLQVYLVARRRQGEWLQRWVTDIVESLRDAPYFGGALNREQLLARGAHPDFADLLIWPKPPFHFKQGSRRYRGNGQHDTPDPSSARVFLGIWGSPPALGLTGASLVANVDVAPTLALLLGVKAPAGAVGKALVMG